MYNVHRSDLTILHQNLCLKIEHSKNVALNLSDSNSWNHPVPELHEEFRAISCSNGIHKGHRGLCPPLQLTGLAINSRCSPQASTVQAFCAFTSLKYPFISDRFLNGAMKALHTHDISP